MVESFAYNNRADGPAWLEEYDAALRQTVAALHEATRAKVLLHLTIPPNRERFIETVPNFHATSPERRAQMADEVTLYLAEVRRIAGEEGWALADVCAEVQKRVAGGEKLDWFINQSDMIHPSRYGYAISARVIVQALVEQEMILPEN